MSDSEVWAKIASVFTRFKEEYHIGGNLNNHQPSFTGDLTVLFAGMFQEDIRTFLMRQ